MDVDLSTASDLDILRTALDQLGERLPESWRLSTLAEPGSGIDAIATLLPPVGPAAQFAVIVTRSLVARDAARLFDRFLDVAATYAPPPPGRRWPGPPAPLVLARYVPASAQEALTKRGISYADATGNIYLRLDDPALFLRDRGQTSDPWRSPDRARQSLRGPQAAAVVRALIDYAPPYGVPQLARLANVAPAVAYRVVSLLETLDLLVRSDKEISGVDWPNLIRRWSRDYSFEQNSPTRFVALRGLPALLASIPESDPTSTDWLRYAATGSLAAAKYAPYAPIKTAMFYVDDPTTFAARLGLRAVDSGADVFLARPISDAVYERTSAWDSPNSTSPLTIVAPAQAAVDLLTGIGRNPSEGEELLRWMQAEERTWRTRPSDRERTR